MKNIEKIRNEAAHYFQTISNLELYDLITFLHESGYKISNTYMTCEICKQKYNVCSNEKDLDHKYLCRDMFLRFLEEEAE